MSEKFCQSCAVALALLRSLWLQAEWNWAEPATWDHLTELVKATSSRPAGYIDKFQECIWESRMCLHAIYIPVCLHSYKSSIPHSALEVGPALLVPDEKGETCKELAWISRNHSSSLVVLALNLCGKESGTMFSFV